MPPGEWGVPLGPAAVKGCEVTAVPQGDHVIIGEDDVVVEGDAEGLEES